MNTNSSLSQTGEVPTQLTARKLNSRISYKIMPGFYYNKNVIYCAGEEQFYRHYNKTKKSHTYICRVDGCKCRIYIQNAQCFVANDLSHNHEKKTGMYYNLCALNEIKRILHSVDNKLLPKQVYDDVIQRHPQATLQYKKHEQCLKKIHWENAAKESSLVGDDDVQSDTSMNGLLCEDIRSVQNDNNVSMNDDHGLELSIDRTLASDTIGQPLLNSTEINTLVQIENVAKELRRIGLEEIAEDESNGNDGEAQCSIPLFEQSKNDNPIAPSIDEANDTVPPAEALALSIKLIGNAEMSSEADVDTPVVSLSQDESRPQMTSTSDENVFKYQVHMREADVNRLMQDGHIYFDQGQLRYK